MKLQLFATSTRADGGLLSEERNAGMFPLMEEINNEVARTDISHVAQLLRPARCSSLTGVVVRVQGPVPALTFGTQTSFPNSELPLKGPLTPSPPASGFFSISLMLWFSSSRCRKLRFPLHRRSASPSSLAFAIPLRSSQVVKSAANLGGDWFHPGFIRTSSFLEGQFIFGVGKVSCRRM